MSVANSIQKQSISELQTTDGSDYEALREIISKQSKRNISHDYAVEIGNSLIEFFEVLAEDGEADCDPDD